MTRRRYRDKRDRHDSILALLPQGADGDSMYRRRWDDIRPEDRDVDRELAIQADLDDAVRIAHIEQLLGTGEVVG